MGYIISLKTAIILFPAIAFLFTTPFVLHNYHKYGSVSISRTLIVYSFILYMMCAYFLVILPLPAKSEVHTKAIEMMQLRPFSFIGDILRDSSFILKEPSTYLKALTEPCIYTVLLNILLTVPFGMYMRYYYECDLAKTLKYTFLLSLFFELTQLTGLYFIYPGPYRVFDVDDLIMNTLGGVLGYKIVGLFDRILPSRKEIDELSFQKGKSVSGLRRLNAFFLDLLIYSIFYVLFPNDYRFMAFIVYFVIIPLVTSGQTLGLRFLNICLLFSKYKHLALPLRAIFLYFYYFKLPLHILSFVNYLGTNFFPIFKGYLLIVSGLATMLFYVLNIFCLLAHKKIFYDDLFSVCYISTIKREEYDR